MTRFLAPVPGACFAGSHSPWPPALRSTGSAAGCPALFVGFLATMAESDFPRPCIISYGSSPPNADQRIREWSDVGPPGSRSRSFDTCQVLRPRRAAKPCDFALGDVAFRLRNSVGTRNCRFRGSMAGLRPPLPTLRRRPCERQRTARGRCGSLRLHRVGLAPYTCGGRRK
jgi:hypothetical protein